MLHYAGVPRPMFQYMPGAFIRSFTLVKIQGGISTHERMKLVIGSLQILHL